MTQLELTIQSLEAAIRATQTALMRPKNARARERDNRILAGLNKDLDALKEQHLQKCIDESYASWEGVDVQDFMDMVRGREEEAVKENQEVWDKILRGNE